jgi:hypothetical protein
MVEKANDIVERLRKEATGVTVNLNPWPTMGASRRRNRGVA